jgi:hypothetical protein
LAVFLWKSEAIFGCACRCELGPRDTISGIFEVSKALPCLGWRDSGGHGGHFSHRQAHKSHSGSGRMLRMAWAEATLEL